MHSTDSYYPQINKRGIYSFFLVFYRKHTIYTAHVFYEEFFNLKLGHILCHYSHVEDKEGRRYCGECPVRWLYEGSIIF